MGQGSGGFRGFSQPDVSQSAVRVTRGLLVGTGAQSLFSLAPVWNTTGTPTAFKINATDTASSASSLLADFQVGGTSFFSVKKSAALLLGDITSAQVTIQGTNQGFQVNLGGKSIQLNLNSGQPSTVYADRLCVDFSNSDVFLVRDAANILALRSGTLAQQFNLYNTFTSSTNFERLDFKWGSNVAQLWTEKGSGGGTARDMVLGADATEVMRFTSSDCKLATAKTLSVASGTNQRAGNATLIAGTVTVNNTTVTANTIVILTRKTSGGTIGTAITYTVSAGASFTITSDNILDTSTFSYLLIEVP